MKKILIIILLIATFSACENTLDNYELPYSRKLVISAVLTANDSLTLFRISLTQPPLAINNFEAIDSDKLTAYIESDGERWDLELIQNHPGDYEIVKSYHIEDFVPEAGRTYSLYANYENMTATARTYVPNKPVILGTDTVQTVGDSDFSMIELFCTVKGEPGVVYSGSNEWDLRPVTVKNSDNEGNVDVYLGYTFKGGNQPPYDTKILDVYDIQFYDYVLSKQKYNDVGFDLFSSSGNNIIWNIKGDGIGVFLGRYREKVDFVF